MAFSGLPAKETQREAYGARMSGIIDPLQQWTSQNVVRLAIEMRVFIVKANPGVDPEVTIRTNNGDAQVIWKGPNTELSRI